mmetsp:Transcript_6397/g.20729  ORF Transcript_6397/g.20729 Transcript_6397/m.20729 type:complete len:218 (-) Transcript_6397:293-946(-)
MMTNRTREQCHAKCPHVRLGRILHLLPKLLRASIHQVREVNDSVSFHDGAQAKVPELNFAHCVDQNVRRLDSTMRPVVRVQERERLERVPRNCAEDPLIAQCVRPDGQVKAPVGSRNRRRLPIVAQRCVEDVLEAPPVHVLTENGDGLLGGIEKAAIQRRQLRASRKVELGYTRFGTIVHASQPTKFLPLGQHFVHRRRRELHVGCETKLLHGHDRE